MKKTPAQLNREKKLAAKTADDSNERSLENATEYERVLIQLNDDKRTLKGTKSTEKKIAAKKTMLPEYDGWIKGVLESDNGNQDDVLGTCMVWHIDAGNYAQALPIAAYMIKHDLSMPDQYNRDVATAIVDEIGVAALGAVSKKEPFDADIINQVFELVNDMDMHDGALARLYKAKAYVDMPAEDSVDQTALTSVLDDLKMAVDLKSNIGVKKDIERIERKLKNLAPSQD